ncbi:hypothetical protein D018_3622B, partial [Vibrio parahaemolyticus VP2007-007]
QLNKYDAEFSN